MAPVFSRARVSTSPEIQVLRGALRFFRAGRVVDVTQGRRAKRLPLATLCRAAGARWVISLMSLLTSFYPVATETLDSLPSILAILEVLGTAYWRW